MSDSSGPTRRQALAATVAAPLAVVAGSKSALAVDSMPNILFILADDFGYADLSCYGRSDYATPHIDRLAAEGMKLTQAYANSAARSGWRTWHTLMSRWIAIAGLMLLVRSAAWPHHNSSASFDVNNVATLNGTLSKLDWRNPHIELVIEIKDKQKQLETWSVEGPAPIFFRDRDINKSDIESALGKIVIVEASPARDGSKWGLLRTLTLPGGKVVSACPQNC